MWNRLKKDLNKENCKSKGFAFCFALALHYLLIK